MNPDQEHLLSLVKQIKLLCGVAEELILSLEEREEVSSVKPQSVEEKAPSPESPNLPVVHVPTMGQAVTEVAHQLGGVVSSTESRERTEDGISLSDRSVASQRAATVTPAALTRDFRPSLVGYTASMFREDYPDVEPADVIESFFSHHLSKGDVSKNWMEKFWSYARRAQEIAEAKKVPGWGETDSMGLPLDMKKRREMLGQDDD